MNEIATPIAAAAVGSGDDNDDDGIVGTLISHFESALKVERTFYGILLSVWLALFLIGLAVVVWHTGGREKFMALRGVPSFSSPPGYSPPEPKQPRWKAWLTNNHPIYDSLKFLTRTRETAAMRRASSKCEIHMPLDYLDLMLLLLFVPLLPL